MGLTHEMSYMADSIRDSNRYSRFRFECKRPLHRSLLTTYLSFTLLVKEFLRLTDCVIHPIRRALLSSKMQISPDKLNNLCITDRNCY